MGKYLEVLRVFRVLRVLRVPPKDFFSILALFISAFYTGILRGSGRNDTAPVGKWGEGGKSWVIKDIINKGWRGRNLARPLIHSEGFFRAATSPFLAPKVTALRLKKRTEKNLASFAVKLLRSEAK